MNGPAPRQFHLRWWMWTALVAAALASALVVVRLHGSIELSRVQADIAARGLPGLDTFIGAAPPVDADRQARLARLMRSQGTWADSMVCLPSRDLRELRPSQRDRERTLAAVTAGQPVIAELEAILDEGPVVYGLLGWLPRDAGHLRRMSPQDIWRYAPAMLASCRTWMNWYDYQACMREDPRPALRRMDAIAAAMGAPGSLLDAMFAIAVSAMRDRTYMWLTSRGRLQPDDLAAWMAEPPSAVALLRHGLAGERLLGPSRLDAMDWEQLCVAVDPVAAPHVSPGWQGRWRGAAAWLLLRHEMAVGIDATAAQEEYLAGAPPRAAQRMPMGLPSQLGNDFATSAESLLTGYEAAYAHRMNRVVALCAMLHRSGKALPADDAALAAMAPAGVLTASSPDEPAIRYERLSGSRIRCGLDPAAARPPTVPASRWSTTTVGGISGYGTCIGSPASTQPYVWLRWSIEIDLDAILVPPPERAPRKVAP